jgi:hypothetical protein
MDLFDYAEENAKKERALDAVEISSKDLVDLAKQIADDIAEKNGTVTSPQVLARVIAICPNLQGRDPRFMGAVFRKGWERVGFENAGSHSRPVSIWRKLA